MLRVLMFLALLGLAIFALVDCIRTNNDDVKHLPKPVWMMVIVFAWVLGPIAWLLLGKRRAFPAARGNGGGGVRRGGGWVAPDDNPDFLRTLNEEQRREENDRDKKLFESWEEDLRRREEDLRRGNDDDGSGPPPGTGSGSPGGDSPKN
ncbi:hypothetical protein FNQ90_15630 [Streptomyces alkaliphilus]|uniref:Cardiolipin synthase N-terminal domain-containing protein n=2 Tax=Streptomyces alkaliphilus TaxID=1472722 RepID=A0A7W3TEP7_9ACTN|nr:PLD nuclease N-terminal domain-containing protein [Streptomyces alkaliphilus]MBB0245494.1 hypothetical protein [Streptomyces alkaliphilus]